MASSDGNASAKTEITTEEPSAEACPAPEADKTLLPALEEKKGFVVESNGGDAFSSEESEHEEGEEEDTLERATELFEKGSKAIEDGDFAEAVDCLSRALEIRAANYGELSPECASSYYKYGCALLYKAQEETDPLGDVPKNTQRNSTKNETAASIEEGGSSVPSFESKAQNSSSTKSEMEEGSEFKNTEDENEVVEGDDEELGEADEDDSDLDLAWKMLDIARAIFEKNPENSIEKVNVFSSLGEVSMEREDVETSLSDYCKALTILEHLVEPDNRRVIELNFRICLVLELGSKVEEAIPYCEKAISLCKSRLERLKEASIKSKDANEASEKSVSELDEIGKELSSESSNLESEIDLLSSISTELEKKLEDLQQLMSNPKSILAELLKKNDSASTSAEKTALRDFSRSSSVNSSQMATIEGGGFDSPAISTAANGSVTHLGVVGRGIKRAIVTPTGAEPYPKKSPSGLSVEKSDSCVSEVLSNPQTSEASSK